MAAVTLQSSHTTAFSIHNVNYLTFVIYVVFSINVGDGRLEGVGNPKALEKFSQISPNRRVVKGIS